MRYKIKLEMKKIQNKEYVKIVILQKMKKDTNFQRLLFDQEIQAERSKLFFTFLIQQSQIYLFINRLERNKRKKYQINKQILVVLYECLYNYQRHLFIQAFI
ncbi:hypothetical protein ABPG74_004993 [Tetrahymena malaccensis]